MKVILRCKVWIALAAFGALVGCAPEAPKSASVSEIVRKSLNQAGLKNVSVSEDRTKGVLTLGGQVETEAEKSQAEYLAKPLAAGQVVAVEIAVVPIGAEKTAKAINSDVDMGIEKNLAAALRRSNLYDFVKYHVKNSVVTLTGEVQSEAMRTMAEKVSAGVPYVKQVVNTLQVKNQKATSTK